MPERDVSPADGGRAMGLHAGAALVGTWLSVSVLLWPHSPAQRAVTAFCGVLTFALALLSMVVPAARYLNAALAAVLVVLTIWLAPSSPLTLWSNGFAALAVIALSLFDGTRTTRAAPPQRTST
jgi:hypothetical protein